MKKGLYLLTILAMLLQPGLTPWISTPALGMSAGPHAPASAIRYVKPDASGDCTSWATACGLQPALSGAVSGDEIWVQAGVYKPTIDTNRTVSFDLKSGVALYGGFAGTESEAEFDQRDWVNNVTTLSGDLGTARSYHVVRAAGVDSSAVLDGFTVEKGNANSGTWPDDSGGGMFNTSGSSPVLANLTFANNTAGSFGGGMYNLDSSPILTDVIFYMNSATDGGGMFNDNSSPTLTDVIFFTNSATSTGGGIKNYYSNNSTLRNVSFISNTAGWGAGMTNQNSSPELINGVIHGNIADHDGAGIHNYNSSSPTLVNVTLSDNAAGGAGGGMDSWDDSSPTLNNTILWGNSASGSGSQIFKQSANGTFTLNYSLVEGGCPQYVTCDAHLVTDDPQFVDSASGNLRLKTNSSAIDAGDNAAVLTGVITDLDGSPRFVDMPGVVDTGNGTSPLVDMGAYEAQLGGDIIYVDQDAPGPVHDGTSWANAFPGLQTALAAANSVNSIWVAEGIYYPGVTGNRLGTFQLKSGVALYGGFAGTESETEFDQRDWVNNVTTLSGDLGTARSYHVVRSEGVDSSAVLDGFTVEKGNADGASPDNYGGGMFNTSGSSPVLANLTFSGNSAAYGGGMYNSSCSPTLTEVIFDNNTATYRGGAMYNLSSSPTLNDVTFSSNKANSGGGMENNSGSSPVLENVDFLNNTTCFPQGYQCGSGGGMHNISDSNPVLTDVTFSGNNAGIGGGMTNYESSPSLTNVIFSNNGGGGMFNESNSSPTLFNVQFLYNTGGIFVDGGGMGNYSNSNPMLTDVTFTGNTAFWTGGGMYNSNSNPMLTDVTFTGNTAPSSGGGMSNFSSSPTLTGVTFSANTADNGGGMYNYASSPTLTNITFTGNSASSFGGGLYNNASSPTLVSVTFSGNTATNGGGGGMYNAGGSNPSLTGGTFSGNQSIFGAGGGMSNVDSSPTLTGVTFSSNSAPNGGGMSNIADSSPTLTDVTFEYNSGSGMYNDTSNSILSNVRFLYNSDSVQIDGGGMSNYDSSPSLTDVTFTGNTAFWYGGGMGNHNSSPSLMNVSFSGNTANSKGGGMYNTSGSSPTLNGVTFNGNSASGNGGGMYNGNSSPELIQTSFTQNEASNGGGMYTLNCTPLSYPTLVNVVFNANQATGTGDEGRGGGLYTDNCPAELTNVTVAYNSAGSFGGGIYATGSYPPAVHNSLLWGNTGSGATADNQYHGIVGVITATTQQANDTDPSPFIDADGADNIPGTPDDNLHPTYPSTYADGAVIDGGDESRLPDDDYDLDGDGITTEKLPVDFDGHVRIYADNDLDGVCDPVGILETDIYEQVDRGAYEAGCWAWHMQTGNDYLEDGRYYRLGFHAEIDDPSTVTIGQTLSAYALERANGNLEKARQSFEIAIQCAATPTQSSQAAQGLLDAIWEQATGAMLEGNEQMVQVLDVAGSGASVDEIGQLIQARNLYAEAVRGYLEPLASGDLPLEALTESRPNPIDLDPDPEASLVDLERLLKASASKSRANLELAERYFRAGQEADAEETLHDGVFQAQAEMALVYSLWPEVVESVDYTALLRNLGDMDRLQGYMASGKNPLGYDPDFIPFSFDYEHPDANNFLQTWYIAGRDLDTAETAVANAVGKQQEVDDDYEAMQTRLSEVDQYYNSILVGLCGPGPDLENCAGPGTIHDQEQAVENAMLQVERVLLQMDNQNALIRIEQERVAAEVGIRYATARLITQNGEELASLAKQEIEVERKKTTTEGIFSIIGGIMSGVSPLGVATPKLSVGKMLLGGLIGGATAALDWQSQNAKADKLADIAASKERLAAKQQAVVQYAEGDIANANSRALQRQYMLKFSELDIDLALAMNNLQKELDHLVNLRNQAEYALAEQVKAQAFTALLYQDPAGRVLREEYMELAHYRYERTLDSAFKAGKALAYEVNEDVTYTGLPLSSLDDLYPLQDVNLLGGAMDQMEDAYQDWLNVVHAPQDGTYNFVYLSLAVGFDDDSSSTREEKFNAYIQGLPRTDKDGDGCPEVQFSFQTSIQTGNKLSLLTDVFNDKITSLQMRVYGTDLFYDNDPPRTSIPGIRLTQGGTSMIRTRFSEPGADDLRFYNLVPWTVSGIEAAVNGNPFPGDPYTGLASRSVAATEWTITIEGGAGPACGELNLDNIEDIQLIIDHEFYSLQGDLAGGANTTQDETPPVREYQPTQRILPALSLGSPLTGEGSLSPATPSADNDLNGLFVGTMAITAPLYLPPVELSLQLTDDAGSLSGTITPTLTFPIVGGDQGPALSGSWSGDSFSLSSQPFVSELSEGIPVTRTIQLQEGLITNTGTTRILSGTYLETLEGLTSEPLEMSGVFRLERPLRPLHAGFGASPRSVYAGDNVFFSDASLGNPVSWSWSFGDGGTSTEQNPVHVYAAPGDYTVSLTIGDGSATHTHTETEYISVMTPAAQPQASFAADLASGPVPLEVSFQDHSLGGPTSWLWSFGDGSTSTQRNPTHVYTQVGVFTVSLTVSNSFGSDILTQTGFIDVTPVAIYIPVVRR